MKRRTRENLHDAGYALAIAAAFGVSFGTILCVKDVSVRTYRTIEDITQAVADLNVEMAITENRMQQVERELANVQKNNEAYASELEFLARCVEAEAGNQSIDVKRAVVSVVLNRVDDEDWPDTISEVIKDPYEFATYWNGRMDEVEVQQSTYAAIQMEMDTRSYPGLYYFDMDQYLIYGTPYKKMGDLYFSTK